MYMEKECPMCGRKMEHNGWESYFANDPTETKNQIDNLNHILDMLESGEESVITLAEDRYEMCPLCQDIMKDMEKEADRHTLEERINKATFKLEEQEEHLLPGHL